MCLAASYPVIACQVSKITRSGSFSKLKGKELIAEAINLNFSSFSSFQDRHPMEALSMFEKAQESQYTILGQKADDLYA